MNTLIVIIIIIAFSITVSTLIFLVITKKKDNYSLFPGKDLNDCTGPKEINLIPYEYSNKSLQPNPLPFPTKKYFSRKDENISPPYIPKYKPQQIFPLPGNSPSTQPNIHSQSPQAGYLYQPPQKLASLCNTAIYPMKNTYNVNSNSEQDFPYQQSEQDFPYQQQAGPLYPINPPYVSYGKWNGPYCDNLYYNSPF